MGSPCLDKPVLTQGGGGGLHTIPPFLSCLVGVLPLYRMSEVHEQQRGERWRQPMHKGVKRKEKRMHCSRAVCVAYP